MSIDGTSGNDHLRGTDDSDSFDLSQGGNDTVRGLDGFDLFDFGAEFNGLDHVYGGKDNDTILLNGDYSAGITLGQTSMVGVENFDLTGAFSYRITFADGNIAAHHQLVVDASPVSGGSIHIDGSAETDGNYLVIGTDLADVITTGAGNDQVYAGDGEDRINVGKGHDTVDGGEGSDLIVFNGAGALDPTDRINGGGADEAGDTVELNGNYAGGLTLQADTLHVGKVIFDAGHSYALNVSHIDQVFDGTGGPYIYDASALGTGDFLHLDGHGLGNYDIAVYGGAGDDSFIGGGGYDYLVGNGGADTMDGRGGPDVFAYDDVSDSTGPGFDTVVGFNTADDYFFPTFGAIDGGPSFGGRVVRGSLDLATFNHDLRQDVGAAQLGADDAILFKAKSGDLAGHWFLIVDGNSTAGYQNNADLVVYLESPKHLSDFDIGNFGTAG